MPDLLALPSLSVIGSEATQVDLRIDADLIAIPSCGTHPAAGARKNGRERDPIKVRDVPMHGQPVELACALTPQRRTVLNEDSASSLPSGSADPSVSVRLYFL